jgi:hypothetical protein
VRAIDAEILVAIDQKLKQKVVGSYLMGPLT